MEKIAGEVLYLQNTLSTKAKKGPLTLWRSDVIIHDSDTSH